VPKAGLPEVGIGVIEFAGGRVTPFEERHLTPRYVSWLNDPEVVRYSEQRHRTHTLDSCRAYFESFRGSPHEFLAIEASVPELGHIGNIGVAVDVPNATGDVSIIVGEKRAWGTGLASKAWCAVVEALLQPGRLRKVTAGTMEVNLPMLRLMARSGMTIEGRKEGQFLFEGRPVALVQAARFR
jgi:ribosomal-protein-alanine N-acetyltransferase